MASGTSRPTTVVPAGRPSDPDGRAPVLPKQPRETDAENERPGDEHDRVNEDEDGAQLMADRNLVLERRPVDVRFVGARHGAVRVHVAFRCASTARFDIRIALVSS